MNVSAPWIRRPVATTLIAVGILLLGVIAYARLPIAALPSVDRPTIALWAGLPGASADTIAAALAQPLERQIGAIPGVVEMRSFSATGGVQLVVQFQLDKDADAAAAAVQAAINAAGPSLPRDLPQPPGYWKTNPAGWSVITLALTSDVLESTAIYEYADSVVAEQIAQVPGISQVSVSGAERAAVRIRADPGRIAAMGISLEQIRTAVRTSTVNLPKGRLNLDGRTWTIAANDQLYKARDYRDVVVAWRNGAAVRLSDIADVSDSVVNARLAGWYNDRPAVIIRAFKQPEANIVATVDAVMELLPRLQHWMPPAIKVNVVFDRSRLIRAAIAEVQVTILIAIGLVVLVVALFLRRVSATVIPALAIPVALAATLIGMDLLGYSLDNLTLMGITIAIGFVVDDAVIMIENIMRRMEAGAGPVAAALEGARQIGFTVLSITAALVAALIPVLFMPDIAGRYFRELGFTLVLAIVASAVVSLTLTPMLCSRFLPAAAPRLRRDPSALRLYLRSLRWVLRHRALTVAAALAVTAGSAFLYLDMPKGFMPTQDTGVIWGRTVTAANVSFTAMTAMQRAVGRVILDDPAVEGLNSYVGTDNGSVLSSGEMLVALKPPAVRRMPVQQVIERLRDRLATVEGIRTFLAPAQDLQIGVQNSASRYQYTMTASDPGVLAEWAERMRRAMAEMKGIFDDVINSNEVSGLQARLEIDRARAAAMGVTPLAIDNTLYDAFGQRQIRTVYLPGNYARVVLEAGPARQADTGSLDRIFVPGIGNAQVPLAAVTRLGRGHGTMWMIHSGQFPAVTISFDVVRGVSLGQAIAAVRGIERAVHLPDDIHAEFRGEAGEATKAGRQQLWLFLAAVFTVYIVLGVLYESFAHPFTILTTLPPAIFGALLALRIAGIEFTLITTIACILLVGMVMKNAIMLVDFALQAERRDGLAPLDAILLAARRRVRPIVMTTLVAVLSAVPLALGTGPGFELRQPLGVSVVGGLLASQLLTLYTTPVIYLLVARLRRPARQPSLLAASD
ncbi:MAG: efflux RND transporter permease subunit [Acetobacteraceae bacterium]